jgi:hypothetical protein
MRIEPIATGSYATGSTVADAYSVAAAQKRGGADISNATSVDSTERLQSLVRTFLLSAPSSRSFETFVQWVAHTQRLSVPPTYTVTFYGIVGALAQATPSPSNATTGPEGG